MIRKSSNGYTVYARTGRPMGTYRTREQAEVRLGQLEAFKAQRAPQMSPTVRPKRGGYYVRAKSGRNMGWYPTKAEALRRKGQLEANGAKFFKETRGYTRQGSPGGEYVLVFWKGGASQVSYFHRLSVAKSEALLLSRTVADGAVTVGHRTGGRVQEVGRAVAGRWQDIKKGEHSWPGQPRRHTRQGSPTFEEGGGGLLAVRLDDPKFPGNGGVVVAHPKSAAEFEKLIKRRDGARDPNMRLWRGNAPIGTRVSLAHARKLSVVGHSWPGQPRRHAKAAALGHRRAARSPTSEVRGKRVQLHPGTDQWMMGDRYGTVTRVNKDGTLQVKMDRSGKSLRVRRDHVGEWL